MMECEIWKIVTCWEFKLKLKQNIVISSYSSQFRGTHQPCGNLYQVGMKLMDQDPRLR